jgi:alpha/beta superfamily hydrolase
MTLYRLLAAGLLASVFSAVAADVREVSFATADKATIYANLYGEGDNAVVLAHGAVFNKESWGPFALKLEADGHTVLAIDFRGYGKSKGKGRASYEDVLGAVRYLHQQGASTVSVVGGSMGGYASALASVYSKAGEIDRLVLLASSSPGEPGKLKGDKLFVVSEGDGLRDDVVNQHRLAGDPKQLLVLPGSAHAQHIFKTPHGAALEKAIRAFLRGQPVE